MSNPRSQGTSRKETGRTYLGWRHAVLLPAPGPAPRRPAPSEAETLSEDWIAEERDSEAQNNRPLLFALVGLGLVVLFFPLLWVLRVFPGILAVGGVLACAAVAAPLAFALVQSRQVVAERLERAQKRLAAEREERDRALHEQQREHARRYTEWQAATRAYEAQPRWHGVTVPADTGGVVVVGGTGTGWSALLTTVALSRLREGGDLTVVDLTGRSVAQELVSLSRRCAVAPRHWVLPADLPRMTLGTNLDAGQRARILSAVAAASGRTEDVDTDETLLLRLLEVLGPRAGIAELIGGLRALTAPQDDDLADDPALALLTEQQRTRVRERCRPDDPDVWARAWELERRLSPFETVGTRADDGAYAQVKIISTDRASGEAAARVYGTYAVAALSELLEPRTPRGTETGDDGRPRVRPDRVRTVVVCGAEALPDEEVDQVLSVAGDSGVEVVLMFGTAAPAALARFTDPSCLPVVMRQLDGSAETLEDVIARVPGVASGEREELVPHRLSEVVGAAVQEASSVNNDTDSDVAADSRFFPALHTESGATIRNVAAAIPPLDLVRHVRSATEWGRATVRAAENQTPDGTGEGRTALAGSGSGLDAESLRELPPTVALVLTPEGPVLADSNPGILTLSTATLATVEDSRNTASGPDSGTSDGTDKGPGGGRPRIVSAEDPAAPDTSDHASADSPSDAVQTPARVGADSGRADRVPPNLGPPPERLDWRV